MNETPSALGLSGDQKPGREGGRSMRRHSSLRGGGSEWAGEQDTAQGATTGHNGFAAAGKREFDSTYTQFHWSECIAKVDTRHYFPLSMLHVVPQGPLWQANDTEKNARRGRRKEGRKGPIELGFQRPASKKNHSKLMSERQTSVLSICLLRGLFNV